MPTLYLVRHGAAAARWDEAADPGLSDEGREQAARAAAQLSALKPQTIVTSPMRRCRETAAPLAQAWSRKVVINERVSEIISPTADPDARGSWLRDIMNGRWGELDPVSLSWRQSVIEALEKLEQDCVVYSHFVAINAAVGQATDDDRVLTFRPANCSVTILNNDGGRLQLVERGAEATTKVG